MLALLASVKMWSLWWLMVLFPVCVFMLKMCWVTGWIYFFTFHCFVAPLFDGIFLLRWYFLLVFLSLGSNCDGCRFHPQPLELEAKGTWAQNGALCTVSKRGPSHLSQVPPSRPMMSDCSCQVSDLWSGALAQPRAAFCHLQSLDNHLPSTVKTDLQEP